jgi:hypothetical protein
MIGSLNALAQQICARRRVGQWRRMDRLVLKSEDRIDSRRIREIASDAAVDVFQSVVWPRGMDFRRLNESFRSSKETLAAQSDN